MTMYKNIIIKITRIVIVFLVILWATLLSIVLLYSNRQLIYKSDAIVVLGHAVNESNLPSQWLSDRLTLAYNMYKKNYAPYIVVTGGTGPRDNVPVAYVMYYYLVHLGVPSQSIIKESMSSNTYENFKYTSEMSYKYDIQSILLVTSNFHIYRSIMLANIFFNEVNYISSSVQPFRINAIFAYVREPISIIVNFFVYVI